ncbi:MAG: hypothetical protein JXR73_14515 [Candidatus Omnitrophica bacterium]|nr:hypothetical protein [Candidatus Omnitrophota bacterium]
MNLLSSLYGFAFCLEIFALALMILFVWNTANRFRRYPETRERRRRRKMGRDAFIFMSGLVLLSTGLAFLNFALFLQAYRTFTVGEPIARISISDSGDEQRFIAKVREMGEPLSQGASPMDQEFDIKGDQWLLEGHIIRFQPWLSFLGFKPVYQLTRIGGRYYFFEDEQNKERTVYPLVDHASEKWWRWMYKNEERIPFMELVHGSAVSQDAKAGSRYVVTVLPTGFSLQKTETEDSSP